MDPPGSGSIRPWRNAEFAAQLRGGSFDFLGRMATFRLAPIGHVGEGADHTVQVLLYGFTNDAFDRHAKRKARPEIVVIARGSGHGSAQLQRSSRSSRSL